MQKHPSKNTRSYKKRFAQKIEIIGKLNDPKLLILRLTLLAKTAIILFIGYDRRS